MSWTDDDYNRPNDFGSSQKNSIDWGALGGAIINAAGSAIGGYYGYKGQQETNALTQQLNDKQIALQYAAWAREDNAIQRRMADLKAAGLSPTLAAGSAAAASAPSVRLKGQESGLGNLGAGIQNAIQNTMTYYQIQQAKNANRIDKATAKRAEAEASIATADAEIKDDLKVIQKMAELERFGIIAEDKENAWLQNQILREDYKNYDTIIKTREKTLEQIESAIKRNDMATATDLVNTLRESFETGARIAQRAQGLNETARYHNYLIQKLDNNDNDGGWIGRTYTRIKNRRNER